MARYAAVATLLATTTTYDDLGVPTTTPTERKVYANEMSMGANAFYAAAQAGVHPSAVLQVRRCDYKDETRLRYGGKTLSVTRVQRTPDYVTLTCEEVTSDRG
jgi:SPP1 family predicted phage head-tail adaptor